ncbi:DNA-binding transcriptional regulator of glucitol operon [Saccharopolyspora erythraea NRRL 2338]|uniref:Uncharacterized protein n=2 Tax=Saccharopolyspora erythraea TaxID=1836 RepID=A4FN99_SACEN|nr:hypothetical protein [Saccharopolyspora erythraea]EQD82387.1 hypothetical protein N599_30945 [Saccharopolyspora erythraea D]PFG99163.1 DNA-binding transcriptional regulator of glucitol operon [Saccharopolyspora erythraea NRRL 2338]QRK89113.1 hypothetical protein JQX30_31810 [Saccharopolyspora erythraea]CAM05524.1 hypothetical protein SACE_6354 [Saccharopolyspora erythraea NRRL 2338]
MNRSLLTPRWLLLHLLFLAATIATGFLARWQWDRAHEAGGSAQNLGYALMWPLFGAFTIFLWVRVARMHKVAEAVPALPETGTAEAAPSISGAAAASAEQAAEKHRRRPLVPPPAPPVDDDEDPAMAEYNRYLAELNEADRRAG